MKRMTTGAAVAALLLVACSNSTSDRALPAEIEDRSPTTTTRVPDRDWHGELTDSFGGEPSGWARAISRIEDRGSYLHMYVQSTDAAELQAACTYATLLFDRNVQVYRAGDVAAVRTRLNGTCS